LAAAAASPDSLTFPSLGSVLVEREARQ
jgi:hypothetical protein